MPIDRVENRPGPASMTTRVGPCSSRFAKSPTRNHWKSWSSSAGTVRRIGGSRPTAARALSNAAISDYTFIETHDPRNRHKALGKTLPEVIPDCLHPAFKVHMEQPGFAENAGKLIHASKPANGSTSCTPSSTPKAGAF